MKINPILLTIVFLGAVIRFYSLGDNGIGFFRDEAALGFNSWSILQTGADEYGQKLPVIFRSFEVFFMPAYVYLSVPIFAIFGLNEFSARALSGLSGTILILVAFLIANQLFNSKKTAIITAAMVAFSPWSIFYSRGAFEGNLALLFFAIGFYFWLKFFKNNRSVFFFASIFSFVLAMYSYQSPRLVVPLFVATSILFYRFWWEKWKLWFLGMLVALILYAPVLRLTNESAGYHRAVGVSIFSSTKPVPGFEPSLGRWQSLYLVPRELASLYLHYFSPYNLFWEGDYNKQRLVPGFSVFYFWQLPFLFFGIWKISKLKEKNIKFLLVWIILAPIPASLTRDPFHTYRSLLLFLPLSLVIALGVQMVIEKWHKLARFSGIIFALLLFASGVSYLFTLFVVAPARYWRDWDFGYQQITNFLKDEPTNLRIIVDDPYTEAYIHLLFNQVIPLVEYQHEALQKVNSNNYYASKDELRPAKVGRFEFRPVDWPSERGDRDTLFIFPATRLYPSEFSGDPKLKLEKTIFSPSNEPAFYIIRTYQ